MKTILGLLLFFTLCGLSNAQSQSTIQKFSDTLLEQSKITDKIGLNILQMLGGSVPNIEYAASMRAYDSARAFNVQIDTLLTLSYVYEAMQDNRDKIIVNKYFDVQCESTTKMGEFSIITINKALPSIQSAALINELTKMRDANINILQTLEVCKK